MSDAPEKHEKKHDPTPRRLQKAREDGNVFQSQEIKSVGLLLAGLSLLFFGSGVAYRSMAALVERVFSSAATAPITLRSIPLLLSETFWQLATFMLPYFGVLLVVSVAVSAGQTGLNVSFKALEPKPDKISPLKGFKRIFSTKGLFQLFKALVKIAVVAPVAYWTIRDHLGEIMMLHAQPLENVLEASTGWFFLLVGKILAALAVLSAADFAFEKYKWKEDLKMTDKEVKDEAKDSEGDPQMKGKRRQLAREQALAMFERARGEAE